MMLGLITSLSGVVIAAVFAAAIALLMWWMFRLPRHVPEEVAKARRSLDAVRAILVPTTGTPYAERGVELACRLAQEQEGEILLVYVIEVPRTLPLGAPMPEAEKEAAAALETARGIVSLHNLPARTIVYRARDAGNGVIAVATEHRADLIVLGIGPHRHTGGLWSRTAETLLHRAPCEVVFDKLPD